MPPLTPEDVAEYKELQKSPLLFIKKSWGLTPQPLKPEYQKRIQTADLETEVTQDWFVPKTKREVIEEKLITWQQFLIFYSVERAIAKTGKCRISVESGHGTGKSATLAMLILWFLFCFKDAQIPCTAPTSQQMYDILWKELSLWLGKMPPLMRDKYEWSTSYIRIVERANTWFARAATARKENPEALAGMHGEHVMIIVDEASAVPDEIFATAEGALTSANILVILISNHTRLQGYFHETFKSDKANWQCLSLDSRQSPIVDEDFVQRIIDKYGKDSDEFRIRVIGKAPREEMMDDKGWMPLISEAAIRETIDEQFSGACRMGVDPAGDGKDKAVWAVRDRFKAIIVHSERKSTPRGIAGKTTTLMKHFHIPEEETYIDNFGEGANVGTEIAVATHRAIQGINVGDDADDKLDFINRRAEAYWRLREWLLSGGEIYVNKNLKAELLSIRYKRVNQGRIQVMGKVEMKKMGLRSPDHADAVIMTFIRPWDAANDVALEKSLTENEFPARFVPANVSPLDAFSGAGNNGYDPYRD